MEKEHEEHCGPPFHPVVVESESKSFISALYKGIKLFSAMWQFWFLVDHF